PTNEDAALTSPERTSEAEGSQEAPQPTMLEQMGGVGGLLYSALPVVVFVIINSIVGLRPAIYTAVGSAVLIAVFRIIRKERVQPAVSGLFGVAIAAFIAYRTGSAKGFFAFGIWTNLAYGAAFLVSAAVRWPLAGVLWSALNNTGMAWRSDAKARRYYDVATLVWIVVFGSRFVVQQWLYHVDQVGWLAFARIAMGYPLMGIALLVTLWAVRKADLRTKELLAADQAPDTSPTCPTADSVDQD
ncbi:MAG: DUF3159 domain-containing protein, partial [Sciscionella sp.]